MKEGEDGLWTPGQPPHLPGATIEEVTKSYANLLDVYHHNHHRLFIARLAANPDAAKAEAVVFSWLRQRRLEPQVAESPSVGGPDCLCVPNGGQPLLVEVTALNREAVGRRSGWPDELSTSAHSFGMITPNLWSKARGKAPQFRAADVPRVLIVCLTHVGAGALLGTLAAEWLMMSELKLVWSLAEHGEPVPSESVTDLKNAAFLRLEGDQIVTVRCSISAILLVALWDDQLATVGLLHPDPAVPLDYASFGGIPFLRLEWPISEGRLRAEWVVTHPKPSRSYYTVVSLTNAELRGK